MKRIKDEFEVLSSLIKCIAAQFGEKCEVVLHDLSNEIEHTIVAIENGHVTGREVGGCATNIGFESFNRMLKNSGKDNVEDLYNYFTTTSDGKVLRSSTSHVRDEDGKVIGSICINFDISEFVAAENAIKTLTNNKIQRDIGEIHVQNVNELLDISLKACRDEIGKPVSLMTKEEKVKAIKYLDEKGIFLITKSGNKVCDFFNISKFTLYNFLDQIRKG